MQEYRNGQLNGHIIVWQVEVWHNKNLLLKRLMAGVAGGRMGQDTGQTSMSHSKTAHQTTLIIPFLKWSLKKTVSRLVWLGIGRQFLNLEFDFYEIRFKNYTQDTTDVSVWNRQLAEDRARFCTLWNTLCCKYISLQQLQNIKRK